MSEIAMLSFTVSESQSILEDLRRSQIGWGKELSDWLLRNFAFLSWCYPFESSRKCKGKESRTTAEEPGSGSFSLTQFLHISSVVYMTPICRC